jgi:hypothetical protein
MKQKITKVPILKKAKPRKRGLSNNPPDSPMSGAAVATVLQGVTVNVPFTKTKLYLDDASVPIAAVMV